MTKTNSFIEQYSKNFIKNHTFLDVSDIVEYRKDQYTAEEIERAMKLAGGKTDFKKMNEEFIKTVIRPFIETLPEKEKMVLKDVQIEVLPTFEINASAVKGPDGKYVVVLHHQLLSALSNYNEAQFLSGLLMSSGTEKQLKQGFELLIDANKEIMKCYKYKKYLPTFSRLPAILPRDFYLKSLEKTLIQELFLVAHEYAHIYLGHLSETEKGPSNVQDDKFQAEQNVKRQRQELEADALALKWIINAFKKEKHTLIFGIPNQEAIFYAAEVFMFLHIIEVNTNGYPEITKNSSLNNPLTTPEVLKRLLDLSLQLDQIKSGQLADSKRKHPLASIRLLSVIAVTQELLEKSEGSRIMDMLKDMVFYETFLIKEEF
ncbi:hypothetical protein ACQKNX_23050 [Lysinibacillus sp. NPDC093712]|uniref:hypothetical protein n=1 Tax=Lysinibacillus sp. NPDC093712 TaxID=3390579 RepID=UPI003CFE112E